MSFRVLLLTLLLLVFKISVRAGESDLQYPRREVDRPYVIPGDLRQFRLGLQGILSRPDGSSGKGAALLPVLQYESGYSDTFSWFFNPLPLGFKAQPIFNDHHRLGFLAYYEYFSTGVSVNYRIRFGNQAIEFEAAADEFDLLHIRTRRAELILRPLFQVTNEVALLFLGSYGRFGFASDRRKALVDNFAPDSSDDAWASANGFSAGAEAMWSACRQLDLRIAVNRLHYFANEKTSDALEGQMVFQYRF